MKLFGNTKQHKHVQTKPPKGHLRQRESIADTRELGPTYEAAQAKLAAENIVNTENKPRRLRRWLIVIGVLAVLALVAVIWYSVWREPPDIVPGGIHTPDVPPVETPDVSVEEPPPAEVPDEPIQEDLYNENGRKKGTYTFLLIGSDNGFGNTDTILYAVFDTVDHTLNVVNIPRDTQVNVPWSIKRINAVYANSGNDMARLRQEVGHMVGYEIDESYALVDLEAFVKIVDCIGGVDYDVPVDMYDYIEDQDFNIAVPKGYQHLDGDKALQVVRFRSGYGNADLGRINTQQDFLKAVAKQLLTVKNIPNLPELYKIIEEYVETNLSTANMAFFVEEFLKMDFEDIHFHTVPGEGYSVKGGAYYWIKTDEWVEIVNSGLNPFNVELTEMNMNYLVYQNGDVYTSRGEYYGTSSFLDYNAYIESLKNSENESE